MNRLCLLALPLALAYGVAAVAPVAHAQNADEGYASLKNRPLPRTPAERDSECAWIRSELVRIRAQAQSGAATAAQYNSPALAQSIQAAADRSIPMLQDRYSFIQCEGSPRPVVMPSQAMAPMMAPSQPPAAVVPPPSSTIGPSSAIAPSSTAAPASALADPPPAMSQPCAAMSFDQCFAKCRELTDRTKAQCFDACRH